MSSHDDIRPNIHRLEVPKLNVLSPPPPLPSQSTPHDSTSRPDLRSGLAYFLERSTIHGLNHIASSTSRKCRFIWFCLWLLGILGFFINVSFIIKRYHKKPTLTNLVSDYEIFDWPDFTVCNPAAPFTVHLDGTMSQWTRLVDRADAVATLLKRPGDLFEEIDNLDADEVRRLALTYSTLDPLKFGVQNFSHTFAFLAKHTAENGLMLTVELGSASIIGPEELSSVVSTSWRQSRFNVPCMVIKPKQMIGEADYATLDQVHFGLKFNYDSYLLINSSYHPPKINLYISPPTQILDQKPIELLAGHEHQIAIQMRRLSRESKRKPCLKVNYRTQLYETDLERWQDVIGDSVLCHRILAQQLYIDRCKCYSPFLPYHVGAGENSHPRLCFNMTLFNVSQLSANANCILDVYSSFRRHGNYSALPDYSYCEAFKKELQCEEVSYELTEVSRLTMSESWRQTSNEARSKFFLQQMHAVFGDQVGSNNTFEFASRNFALVSIKRKEQRGQLVLEELEYTLAELFSDIGGLMGLWIGISVIGLFECVELMSYVGQLAVARLIGDGRLSRHYADTPVSQFVCVKCGRTEDDDQRRASDNSQRRVRRSFYLKPQYERGDQTNNHCNNDQHSQKTSKLIADSKNISIARIKIAHTNDE